MRSGRRPQRSSHAARDLGPVDLVDVGRGRARGVEHPRDVCRARVSRRRRPGLRRRLHDARSGGRPASRSRHVHGSASRGRIRFCRRSSRRARPGRPAISGWRASPCGARRWLFAAETCRYDGSRPPGPIRFTSSLPRWRTGRSIGCVVRSPTTGRRSSQRRRCRRPRRRAFRYTWCDARGSRHQGSTGDGFDSTSPRAAPSDSRGPLPSPGTETCSTLSVAGGESGFGGRVTLWPLAGACFGSGHDGLRNGDGRARPRRPPCRWRCSQNRARPGDRPPQPACRRMRT